MIHLRSLVRGLGSLALLALAAFVAGCSSSPTKPQPAELAAFTALQPARQVWSAQIGATHALLAPVVHSSTVYLANAAGTVLALDAATGRQLWKHDLAEPLAAGVGSDGETVAVVTHQNELVALNQGREAWRVRLESRVFTAPLVAGRRVFVLGGDRSVSAYDAQSGARLWVQQPRVDNALVLQQAGVLLPVGDTLLAGISGRLTGLNPLSGSIQWEAPLANPRGANEIEKLVDLVGGVGRVGPVVCARAYQAAVGCVDTATRAVAWTQTASGATGVNADESHVYGTESNGRVLAWRRDNGKLAWRTDLLLHRGLTAPLAAGRSLIVGDASGHLHLLSRDDGGLLNRLTTDGSPIVSSPILAGKTLLAVTRNGGVFAWRPE